MEFEDDRRRRAAEWMGNEKDEERIERTRIAKKKTCVTLETGE